MAGSSVAHETRERVRAAAKILGYVPNMTARLLQANRSRVVAMLVDLEEDVRVLSLTAEVASVLSRIDRQLLLSTVQPGDSGISALANLRSQGVDAVISARRLPDAHHECRSMKVITLNCDECEGCSSVYPDWQQGGRRAAETLLARGARSLLYLGPERSAAACSFLDEGRRAGAATAFAECSADYVNAFSLMESGVELADGVLCADDRIAWALLDFTDQGAGTKPPRNPLIIGVGDELGSATRRYNLSTFSVPCREIARGIARALTSVPPLKIPVSPIYIDRGSARKG